MTCVEVKKEHKLPTPNMKHKRKDTGENFLSSKPTIIKKKRTVTPHHISRWSKFNHTISKESGLTLTKTKKAKKRKTINNRKLLKFPLLFALTHRGL